MNLQEKKYVKTLEDALKAQQEELEIKNELIQLQKDVIRELEGHNENLQRLLDEIITSEQK